MNLPNKLTFSRIIMTMIIILILILPFDAMGLSIPKLFINEAIVVDIRYLIAGVLFILASITDFFDGMIARKRNLITDFGKMLDSIADKVLVNSILIILASSGFIHPIIAVIIVIRDIITDAIKMVAGTKGNVVAAIMTGKIKTACLMIGIVLTLFYNLPFELWNLRVSDIFLIGACIMSIISCIQYYDMNKHLISYENKSEIVDNELEVSE